MICLLVFFAEAFRQVSMGQAFWVYMSVGETFADIFGDAASAVWIMRKQMGELARDSARWMRNGFFD